ncbi:hypothetical protein AKO1_012935 [Acrasis kona]|uniref:histidine kinase n=1 Tax=Acrasis kona TaxID=1008807 RepID=A0AAW2YXT9_9EUKA
MNNSNTKDDGFETKYQFFEERSEKFFTMLDNVFKFCYSPVALLCILVLQCFYATTYFKTMLLFNVLHIYVNWRYNHYMNISVSESVLKWHENLSKFSKFVEESYHHDLPTPSLDTRNELYQLPINKDEQMSMAFVDLHKKDNFYRMQKTLKTSETKRRHFLDRTVAIVNLVLFALRAYFCDVKPLYGLSGGFLDIVFLACRPFDVPEWTTYPVFGHCLCGFLIAVFQHGQFGEGLCFCLFFILFVIPLTMCQSVMSFTLLRKYSILDSLTSELRRLNQVKAAFVSNVSHEFRSPLLSLCGSIDLLRTTSLTKPQLEHLSTMDCCVDILLKLIDDILQFSKLNGEHDTEKTSTMEVVENKIDLERCINHLETISNNYARRWNVTTKVSIDEEIPRVLKGDSIRLQQCLLNILTNASKYSPLNGQVHLNVTKISTDKATGMFPQKYFNDEYVFVQFEIQDFGAGITPERQHLLFQPFSQLDEPGYRQASIPSTGLGLCITKAMVNSMGGNICFESSTEESNHGTIFRILLPIKFVVNSVINHQHSPLVAEFEPISSYGNVLAQYIENANQDDVAADNEELSVIIAEDNPINMSVIKKLIRQNGEIDCNIVTACNGQELVDRMCDLHQDIKKFPKIVITDHHMPIMKGLDASFLLRKLYRDSIKIILLTADVSQVEKGESRSVIDIVLRKPVKGEELRRCIKKLIAELKE